VIFVLLPESLACVTLAPSASNQMDVSKALSASGPHPFGHLRALLLRLCTHNFPDTSYRNNLMILSFYYIAIYDFFQWLFRKLFIFVAMDGFLNVIRHANAHGKYNSSPLRRSSVIAPSFLEGSHPSGEAFA